LPINQFLATAAAEKMSALLTVDYLREEAAQANRTDFEHFSSECQAASRLRPTAYLEGAVS
jgi:hypothetical protein